MKNRRIFIITGEQGEGKTTLLKNVTRHLKERQVPLAGFFAEGEWENDSRKSFSICDINTGEEKLLCIIEHREGFIQAGRFYFNPAALDFGERILQNTTPDSLVVVDEIGRFELQGKVWADVFRVLLKFSSNSLLFTVRKKFLEKVIQYFGIDNPVIFSCDQDEYNITQTILKYII